MKIPYTLNDLSLTFFIGSYGQRTFRTDFPSFNELRDAVIANDLEKVISLAFPKKIIEKYSFGNVIVGDDDRVYYKGVKVPDYLGERIIVHYEQKLPLDSILAFAGKLLQNPDDGVKNDLYKWLEKGNMPVFDDGDFMAYKLVREDYTPIHTGGAYGKLQKVGMVVEQPRETCNPNRTETCSSGLHFCSYEYLPKFQQSNTNRVIVLKINPADVVAIPNDYNDSKGRTCRFHVVDEIDKDLIKETFGSKISIGSLGEYKSEKETKVVEDKAEVATAAIAEHGSKTKAAAALGISRSTLARWLKTPKVDNSTEEIDDTSLELLEEDIEDSWDSWDSSVLYGESFDDDSLLTATTKAEVAQQAIDWTTTNTEAAKLLGISRSTLSRWLNSYDIAPPQYIEILENFRKDIAIHQSIYPENE